MPEYTRKEFVDKLRESLPERYRLLSDDKLLEATYQSGFKPEFKPEPEPDPGFIDGLIQPAKEQFYRLPETAASVYNIVTEQMYPEDEDMLAIRKGLYESASQYSQDLIATDNRLKAFQQWAGENPFDWKSFITNPTMFASTFSSVATSMGTIIGAGLVGGAIAGTPGAIAFGGSAAFALEGGEAYNSAYQRAKEKGYSDEEIDRMSADAGMMYGIGSAVLESIVPLSLLKSFGLSKRIAKNTFSKFAGKYIDDVVAGNGNDAVASGVRAWQQYTLESISLQERLASYAPILGNALTEAGTEGSQYLLEEGIVDNIVDGNQISIDWIAQKLTTPEFSQSIAGGLLGGGVFTAGAKVSKDALYGSNGSQNAKVRHALGKKLPEDLRQKLYDDYINSDDVSHIDKVEFAKTLNGLEADAHIEDIKKDIPKTEAPKQEPKTKKSESKNKKTQTKPSMSPTDEDKSTESLRIKESAGAANLYPTYSDYKREMSEALPGEKLMTEWEWFSDREDQIKKYVETPAIPLVKKLLDQGSFPYSSNAYGPGDKGVWYKDRNGVDRFAPLEEKPTQKPQEPPRSTQKEKSTPSIPKQEAPATESFIENNTVPQKLANPDKGRVSEVPGSDNKDRAANWIILQGQKSANRQMASMSKQERQTVLQLAASALVETSGDQNKAKQNFYNKDGTVNERTLFKTLDILSNNNVFIETTTQSRGLGQPVQVRSRVEKGASYFEKQFVRLEQSGIESEILRESEKEIIKDVEKGVVREQEAGITPSKEELEKPSVSYEAAAAKFIKRTKIKPTESKKLPEAVKGVKLNPAQKVLYDKISSKLKYVNVVYFDGDLRVSAKGFEDKKSRGLYLGNSKTILISNEAKSDDGAAATILHEAVHYLTAKAVVKPSNAKERQFSDRVTELRKVAAANIKNPTLKSKYLSSSNAEFITGVLTEDSFQLELSKIKSTGKAKSLWVDFVDAVKKLLSISESDTLLDEAIGEIVSFIDPQKDSKPEVKVEPKKKSAPKAPKPKENVKTGVFRGTEIEVDGHKLTEDDDLEGFSSLDTGDRSLESNSTEEFYDMEDGRDGESSKEDKEDEELNPREFFMESFGSYLVDNQYAKLVDYVKNYENLRVRNATELKNFYIGLDKTLREKIKEMTGKEPVIENEDTHLNKTKEWFQKTLSRQPVIFEGVSGRGRNKLQMVLRVLDGEVIGKMLQPLSKVKMDTVRRDFDTNELVGGKNHSKTDSISFIEYDQYKFGAKTKLFYLNVNDIYTEDIVTSYSGKGLFSKFRKANYFEFNMSGEGVRRMNNDFAQAFLNGKDDFLKVFFAERSGDNSKIMIAAVPKKSKFASFNRDDLEAMLREDAASGYLYAGTETVVSSKISGFVNHSGGAVGSDTLWGEIGSEYGMTDNRHYYIQGNKTPNGNTEISNSEKSEADSRLRKANETLGRRFPTSNEYVNNLLRRNWWQVKNSDAVFAISTISNNIVDGGTGWAVQMAIDSSKPVYVFDQNKGSWNTWNGNSFSEIETPVLTKNFAGIGTRNINAAGRQAIRDVYEKTSSGNVSKPSGIDHVKQFLDSADTQVAANPLIYAQMAILHDKWKQVKGFNYLTRFKDVASAYKRLKIDTTEGTMIRGIGDTSIMVVEPEKVEIVKVVDGKEIPVRHLKPDGTNAFDGALWSSKRRMNKINSAMGTNSYVFKTFIRYLDVDPKSEFYGTDYIGLKMAEFAPEAGMTVKKDGKVIASYDGLVWKDANDKEFEMLATPDEVKDRSGRYSDNYKILPIPEHATRLKMAYDKSKSDGAHPVAAHELSLDTEYINNNQYARDYLKSVFNHYKSLIKDSVDFLYDLRPEPIFDDMTDAEKEAVRLANIERAKRIREVVKTGLKPGQKLMEMDIVAKIFDNGEGFYMPTFMKQLLPSLNNKFIVNGLFKARQMKKGNATKLLIKPNIGHDIPSDGVLVSAQNKTMYNKVLEAYKASSDISLDGMDKSERVAQLNNWLRENPFYVLVHRQPIQSFTKVVPRRIYQLIDGPQGQSVIMNLEDVFYLHDGDHDGDSVFLEVFDNDLIDKMINQSKQEQFIKRDRTVDLSMFKKGSLGNSLADIESVYKLISDRQNAAGAQGMAVNIKTTLARLSYKDFSVEFNNGERATVYKPTDKAIMWYLPLNEEYLNTPIVYNGQTVTVLDRIKAQGDDVIDIGKGKFLVTTKENEFSILLQASVDNDKFNLLSVLPLEDKFGNKISMHSFMLSRIFDIKQSINPDDSYEPYSPKYYSGNIVPDQNTVFVFGSNPQGRHGAGAAKIAVDMFGAEYGIGEGLQGNAYALPTKNLNVKVNNGLRSIPKSKIINSIRNLYRTAENNPSKQFKVAYRNTDSTSLNGYTGIEMIEMFKSAGKIPENIIFSKEWVATGLFSEPATIIENDSMAGYANKTNLTSAQLKTLKKVYDIFNVSSLRSGNDSDKNSLDMNGVLKESEDYTSIYYPEESTTVRLAEDVSNVVSTRVREAIKKKKGHQGIKSISMNNKLTPSDILVMAPAIRDRQLKSDLSQFFSGLSISGPLEATPAMYRQAHFRTMNELAPWILEQYENDKGSIDEIIKGKNFADRVGTKFYDTFSKVEKGTKKVKLENEDKFNVKYDYDENIQNDVILPYQEEFENMSDIAKKWSSIRFIDGINYRDAKISASIKLMPMQLMHEQTVKEYGVRYMHNIYNDAGSSTVRGSQARPVTITEIFGKIKSAEDSFSQNHLIEVKKDNYCG